MIDAEFDPQAVQDALLKRAKSFRDVFEARIQHKLQGQAFRGRSEGLANSIHCSIEDNGPQTSISLSSSGVFDPATEEFGGKMAAHEIVAENAKALAFKVGGDQVFRKRVEYPGSAVRPHSYLRSALAGMAGEIGPGLKQAILQALEHT